MIILGAWLMAGCDPKPGSVSEADLSHCASDDECVAIRHQCIEVAVNRKYEDYKNEEFQLIRADCPRPENGVWLPLRATCEQGKCVPHTIPPTP